MSGGERRVLVTGATGLLGNNVVRCLLARGELVRVLVRETASTRPISGLDVEIARGDVCRPSDVERAMRDVTHVVHAAASVKIGWSIRSEMSQSNVQGAANVAAVARRCQARLVYVSTVNTLAIGSPDAPANEQTPLTKREVACNYVLTKRQGEQAVLTECHAGLSATIVHPGFMLGPWDWKPSSGKMFLAVARRASPFVPRGGCSVCDVRDVADGIRRALFSAKANACHYILAGHNVTYRRLWAEMAATAGVRPPRWTLGPVLSAMAGRAGDAWGRIVRSEPIVNSASVAMGHQFHYYDSSAARRDLEYTVRPMEETLEDAWRWLCEHHGRGWDRRRIRLA